MIDDAAVDVAVDAIRQALKDGEGDPQLAEIAAHFVHFAGGARGMAKIMFDAMQSPECSPMMRHRILDSVMRSLKFANEQTGPKADLGLANDADLDRELKQLLGKVQGGERGPPA